MIDTVFYLLVKNNKGKGGGVGVKTEGGLLSKLSSMKRGAYFERGGAGRGLIEDFLDIAIIGFLQIVQID